MQLAATNSKVRKTSSWLQQQMQEPGKLPALCCKTSNCLENLLHAAAAFQNGWKTSCGLQQKIVREQNLPARCMETL